MVETVTRAPLRYHGGKWMIADWIISHFPPHGSYVEPFGGGASVLLRKPRAALETYNDLDGEVVNFFRVLREQSAELVARLELTPWSREEYELSWQPTEDPLESARRFFIRSWQSIGMGVTRIKHGWRYERNPSSWRSAPETWTRLDHLHAVAGRLRCVQIEHADAFEIIRRFDGPGALMYLDPPYLSSTLSSGRSRNGYRHSLTDDEHITLAGLAQDLEAFVVVSGYPSDLYADLYEARGWRRVETVATTNSRNMVRTEALWLSPRTAESQQGVLPL